MPLTDKSPVVTQEVLLHRIASRIRQSLEIKEILNAMVGEVCTYLGTDRVKVYQFERDGSGVVIAEAIAENRLPSLVGLHFPADDIPLYARELFVRARQRNVVDLGSHQIGISPLHSVATGEMLQEGQDMRYRPVDPCHVEYLTAMGVKSSVVVPIVLEGRETGVYQPPSVSDQAQLWGLLVSHHSEPRQVSEEELQFIQAVVDQVSVAITQSILLEKVRAQARQEGNLNRIITLLYSTPNVRLQPALEEVVTTFGGTGGRLYLSKDGGKEAEVYTCGVQPELINQETGLGIEDNRLWQNYLNSVLLDTPDSSGCIPWSVEWMRRVYDIYQASKEEGTSCGVWAVNDLYCEPLLRTIAPFFQSTKIRSLLIIPLRYDVRVVGCLTIFRDEFDAEILWAGYHNPDTRQLMARQSFEVWRQIKTSQTQSWTEAEIKYGQALGERFANAIHQYSLYQEIYSLNSSLEYQVQARTQELEETLKSLQNTQSQLIQSEKMSSLGQLVAGIAHEINNPINFISGNINHISEYTINLLNVLASYQEYYANPPEVLVNQVKELDIDFVAKDLPKVCNSLRMGVKRVSEIVASLRNFSRFDHSELKSVDIHEGIESALLILQHRLEEGGNGIQVVKKYSDLPLVECFVGQLNQVFMNLLANAIDELVSDALCNKKNQTITIITEQLTSDWIKISFIDNGRGIKEEVKSKLFDPFFTTKAVGKGTGLGLAVSYRIIQQHGGRLCCYSSPSDGAEFCIEIPVKVARNVAIGSAIGIAEGVL